MLVDDGSVVNLIVYSVFKKLGREDGEVMKTNMTLNVLEGNPMQAKGVVSIELIVGSKSLSLLHRRGAS
jgi:hypothetical protein